MANRIGGAGRGLSYWRAFRGYGERRFANRYLREAKLELSLARGAQHPSLSNRHAAMAIAKAYMALKCALGSQQYLESYLKALLPEEKALSPKPVREMGLIAKAILDGSIALRNGEALGLEEDLVDVAFDIISSLDGGNGTAKDRG
ncbi:MAG: hypothetical protein QXK34_00605 [Candidatus Bathyarchaeia archaeon]